MICSRVLSNDENPVGMFKVLQLHAALSDPDAFLQRNTARLVAHVRAVGQIVGAELSRKKLIQKRGLIARAAARIKCGRVRCWQRIQLTCHQLERVIPFDRLVMSRAFALHHRMDQPALQLQPVVCLLLQVSDRVLTKKFRTDMLFCRLAGQRFDAVLAKLKQVSIFVWTWPGAALAIKSVLFVNLEPIADPAHEAGLARGEFQTLGECMHSGRDPVRRAQLRLRFFFGRFRSK